MKASSSSIASYVQSQPTFHKYGLGRILWPLQKGVDGWSSVGFTTPKIETFEIVRWSIQKHCPKIVKHEQ